MKQLLFLLLFLPFIFSSCTSDEELLIGTWTLEMGTETDTITYTFTSTGVVIVEAKSEPGDARGVYSIINESQMEINKAVWNYDVDRTSLVMSWGPDTLEHSGLVVPGIIRDFNKE